MSTEPSSAIWFILDVTEQLDLAPFYRAHRTTGMAIAPTTPSFCSACSSAATAWVRSSRQLERRCQEDVALRVLAANQVPDQVTIARFRVRNKRALAEVLAQSLKLCARHARRHACGAMHAASAGPAASPLAS